MSINRLFAMIALVMLTSLSAVPATATTPPAQPVDCGEVAAYIEMVDTQVVEEMHALVTTPGWVEDAQRTEGLLQEAPDGGTNPLVAYMAVPGGVLSGIDPTDVPESALTIHESATTYWVTTSDMIEAMVKDGPSASFPFLDTLDTAAANNLAAQADIVEQCPEIPESYADAQDRLDSLFELLDGEGDAGSLADATPEDLEGMGYFFLFFADEPVEARGVTANSTPATVKPIPATPKD